MKTMIGPEPQAGGPTVLLHGDQELSEVDLPFRQPVSPDTYTPIHAHNPTPTHTHTHTHTHTDAWTSNQHACHRQRQKTITFWPISVTDYLQGTALPSIHAIPISHSVWLRAPRWPVCLPPVPLNLYGCQVWPQQSLDPGPTYERSSFISPRRQQHKGSNQRDKFNWRWDVYAVCSSMCVCVSVCGSVCVFVSTMTVLSLWFIKLLPWRNPHPHSLFHPASSFPPAMCHRYAVRTSVINKQKGKG